MSGKENGKEFCCLVGISKHCCGEKRRNNIEWRKNEENQNAVNSETGIVKREFLFVGIEKSSLSLSSRECQVFALSLAFPVPFSHSHFTQFLSTFPLSLLFSNPKALRPKFCFFFYFFLFLFSFPSFFLIFTLLAPMVLRSRHLTNSGNPVQTSPVRPKKHQNRRNIVKASSQWKCSWEDGEKEIEN